MDEVFGLAPCKAEGTTVLYDLDGFNVHEAWDRYWKLKRRWFKTKKVYAEMRDLDEAILIYEKAQIKKIYEDAFPLGRS